MQEHEHDATDTVTWLDVETRGGLITRVTVIYRTRSGAEDHIEYHHLVNLALTGGDAPADERTEIQARAMELLRQAKHRALRWSPLTASPRGSPTARGGEMVLTVDWTGERVTVADVLRTHSAYRGRGGAGPTDAEERCWWAADLLGRWGHDVRVSSRWIMG